MSPGSKLDRGGGRHNREVVSAVQRRHITLSPEVGGNPAVIAAEEKGRATVKPGSIENAQALFENVYWNRLVQVSLAIEANHVHLLSDANQHEHLPVRTDGIIREGDVSLLGVLLCGNTRFRSGRTSDWPGMRRAGGCWLLACQKAQASWGCGPPAVVPRPKAEAQQPERPIVSRTASLAHPNWSFCTTESASTQSPLARCYSMLSSVGE